MIIKKALIAAAGFGTRFLPITKTIQKEMLPVLNRPTVDYLVEDLIKAGVEEIIFVISEHNKQLLHYYSENPRLFSYLSKHGKEELYTQMVKIHQQARFHFVKQSDTDPYGTATPLKLAQSHLANEPAFFVFMGDDFLFNPKGQSESGKMLELYQKSQANGLITCITKPRTELGHYGVVKLGSQNGFSYLDSIVEKPKPEEAPSNLVNISKYILTPEVFSLIDEQKPDVKSGELYIVDTVTRWAGTKKIVVYQPSIDYLDCGNVIGWLEANLSVAIDHPSFGTPTKNLLAKFKDRVN